jgi:uncharacterized protein (TIGR02266 family)
MYVDVLMTDATDDDRRARPRTSIAVELKLHAPEQHFMLLSRTVNLSSQGAFVRTNRPLPVGTTVTVAFQRGAQRNPLTLEAEVVRSGTADDGRSPGIALRFKQLTAIDESLLNEIIEKAQA